MNHILLPDGRGSDLISKSHGTNAMELLINALLRRGAERERLRAKLFGGARMIAGLSDIGEANSVFVEEFCRRESIPCVASSLRGDTGRRIQFWPVTGKARQQFLRNVSDIPEVAPPIAAKSSGSEVELF
ncbi:chemotaxis protein CheD [Tropicimonas sp. TH_r6]|uniref:chemotaxis protein CheD n=1 Tax=Tropicimonas sp. TH_r6 TaxID=3082085 RepID=UPI002953F41E|nr:chemotaxis protein CheD [Tropicimonas sp. TH_r6]MDV7144412.1 chemotaxis protein CheD [Tropicimonas sp. TH_r6]